MDFISTSYINQAVVRHVQHMSHITPQQNITELQNMTDQVVITTLHNFGVMKNENNRMYNSYLLTAINSSWCVKLSLKS